MNVKLLAYTKPLEHATSESLMEYCGRVCTATTDKTGVNPHWLTKRLGMGHESIIEHVSFTFEIDGLSRACSHQLVRHRLASYSQESMRYVRVDDLVNNAVYPESYLSAGMLDYYEEFLQHSQEFYDMLIARGVPAEDARMVLPIATHTRIVMTMNARELRHFLKLRLDKAAQWEIRAVARAIIEIVMQHAPEVFRDVDSD